MEWLERFVNVMDIVSESVESGVSITDIARATGLSKGTLHRVLKDMIGHNLVVQNADTRKYSLGPKSLVWGSKFVLGQDPAGLLAQYCDLLAERTNLYTFLCRMSAGEVYCIYTRQPSKFSKKYFVHVGQRMPIHCTAAAKSILAFLPQPVIHHIISQNTRVRFTEYTKVDSHEIINELRTITETGAAFCKEELELGVSGISTPIFTGDGRAAFSISLLSDAVYITQHHDRLVSEIIHIGKQASEQMARIRLLSSVKEEIQHEVEIHERQNTTE